MKADPIRNKEDIIKIFKYLYENEKYRDLTMISLGLNTALRASDILKIQWKDVYDFERNTLRKHLKLTETKTKKKLKF